MPRPSPEPLAGAAARSDADHVGLAGPINEAELPVGGEVLGFAEFVDALVEHPRGRDRTASCRRTEPPDPTSPSVDADHASLDALTHAEGTADIAGEHVRREPHLGVVGPVDHLVGVGEGNDRGDRAEDLFLRDR